MGTVGNLMSHPDTTIGAVATILIVAGTSLATWAILTWLKNRPSTTCQCQFHLCRNCSLKEDNNK